MYQYIVVFFACFIFPFALKSQVSGSITDPSGDPLAFVSVIPDGAVGRVVISDINGFFSLKSAVSRLEFRCVGYETLLLDSLGSRPLRVIMRPADYNLPEAVIRPGENPADRLVRLAVEHRKQHNPELYRSFRCMTYNKVSFDFIPRRAIFEKDEAKKDTADAKYKELRESFLQLEKNMAEHQVMFMESVTEKSFRAPGQQQERVLMNRVSGFRDMGMVVLANAVQPFSFYGDYITLLDKNFVNPISPGSLNLYFFMIEDTLQDGADTVWVLSFRPRKGKVFNALEGTLYLHSNGWAVRNVKASIARTFGVATVKMEQSYQKVFTADSTVFRWFPDQLNFEIELPKYPSPYVGTRISGRSYIREPQIDLPLRQKDFLPDQPVFLEGDATEKSDADWAPWRQLAPLSGREKQTYVWLDSVVEAKNLGWLTRVINYSSTQKAYLGKGISLDLNRLMKLNPYEGARLGLGLTNAESRPMRLAKRLEAGAWAGYGFSDKAWKYGAYGQWRISRPYQTLLRLDWARDLREPGAPQELPAGDLVTRNLYAEKLDRSDYATVQLQSKITRFLEVRTAFRREDLVPLYTYRFAPAGEPEATRFLLAETMVYGKLLFGEKQQTFLGDPVSVQNRFPVLEFAWTHGFDGLLDGQYAYNRYIAALHQSVPIRRIGRLQWRLEAGLVEGVAPLARLFTLNQGSGDGFNWFVVRNTFQSLPDTLFVADRFANFYLAQEVGPVFYRHKYSEPSLTLLANASWGGLKHPEQHLGIGFGTTEKPLLETGIQLDNLALFNYFNFARIGVGGALFYRWGALDTGNWRKNWVPRLSVRLVFG